MIKKWHQLSEHEQCDIQDKMLKKIAERICPNNIEFTDTEFSAFCTTICAELLISAYASSCDEEIAFKKLLNIIYEMFLDKIKDIKQCS